MRSNLKRIVAAALIAGVAGAALAADPDRENFSGFEPGMTYEQTQVDRALPNVKDPVIDQSGSAGASVGKENFSGFEPGATYEQDQVDRALPNAKDPVVTPRARVAGPATGPGYTEATGPWANDWNFIAPAP